MAKCRWICFGNISPYLDLTINRKALSKLHTLVDLGRKYSYNSSFTEQVSKLTSMSLHLIGYIIHNLFNSESLILMHKVCVRPLLEYCTFILSDVRIKVN